MSSTFYLYLGDECHILEEILFSSQKKIREKYKSLFDFSLDLIYVHDLKGNFLDANDIALKTLGYTKEEISKFSFKDLMDKDQARIAFNMIDQAIEKGEQTKLIEFKLKTKEGNSVYLKSSGIPLKENGEVYAVLCIAKNITEQKKVEQGLKKSEEKYRNMINNLDVGFFKIKIDGTILNHNPVLNKIVGFDPSKSLIGLKIPSIWQYPGDGDKHLKEILEKGFIKNHLVFAKKVNGENIVLQTNSHLIKNNEGKAITIEGTCSNITEKFNLEEKLKESEEKYRLILENANDLIVILNQKFEHEYINEKTYLKVLGYSNDDMLGKTRFDLVHPEDAKQGIRVLMDGFKYGEGKTELRLRHKKGHYLWLEIKGRSFIDNKGEIKAIIISRDITDRKEVENLIKEEISKLKELEILRRDFISRASHELKTPLTSVYSATNLLLQLYKDQLGKNALELVEMIKKGGSRLKFLIENLLDISRLESGRFKLNKKMENFPNIIRDCVQSITYLANKRGIVLNVELLEIRNIEVDKLRIEQVILNLLTNAIKNTPSTGEIKISLIEKKGFLETSIKDSGIGLTKNELNKIFQKFGKIERYGKGLNMDTEGSGLGLYISKEIVENHGGKIFVESKGRNKGANFIVKLPFK